MQAIACEELSDLIGAIYDCAIDPSLWPDTMAAMGRATDCCAGLISVARLDPPEARLLKSWNFDEAWLARVPHYSEELSAMLAHLPNASLLPLDEPTSARRFLPPEVMDCSRYVREMIGPLGIVDVINLHFMREPDRLGQLGLSRHRDAGVATDRELALMRLLAGTLLPADVSAVARMFGLTPAEARMLERLLSAGSLADAAAALGIAEPTAKTHRDRIFQKMGVSRRTDLVALVAGLVPPVRRPTDANKDSRVSLGARRRTRS